MTLHIQNAYAHESNLSHSRRLHAGSPASRLFSLVMLGAMFFGCASQVSFSPVADSAAEEKSAAVPPRAAPKPQEDQVQKAQLPQPEPQPEPQPTAPPLEPQPPKQETGDTTPPVVLALFDAKAEAGTVGRIQVQVEFPSDANALADYEQVSIRRVEGQEPPVDCNTGQVVRQYTKKNGGFKSDQFSDLSDKPPYSYRACIYDASGNETKEQTAANVSPNPCVGKVVDKYCWYQTSGEGQKCSDFCSAHGGTTSGTIDFAGTGGNPDQCKKVMDAVGLSSGPVESFSGNDIAQGCAFKRGDGRRWYHGSPTVQNVSGPYSIRVCSCVN